MDYCELCGKISKRTEQGFNKKEGCLFCQDRNRYIKHLMEIKEKGNDIIGNIMM